MEDHIFHEEKEWKDGRGDKHQPGWYFWDETGSDAYGPFETRKRVNAAIAAYAKNL